MFLLQFFRNVRIFKMKRSTSLCKTVRMVLKFEAKTLKNANTFSFKNQNHPGHKTLSLRAEIDGMFKTVSMYLSINLLD